MTAWLSISSFLLLLMPALLVVVALSMQKHAARPANARMLLVVYIASALIPIWIATIWRLKATRVVIELRGIAFRGTDDKPLREPVIERTAGGGRLLIGDTVRRRKSNSQTFGTLVFQSGKLTVEVPPPASRAGLIAAGDAGLVGAEALEDGDEVCVGGACWKYDDRAFTRNGTTIEIPGRRTKLPGFDWSIPLPFASPSTAGARTWSLEPFAGGTKLRSFLCYASPGPRLRLVALDPGVTLMRNGKPVVPASTARVEDGDRIRFYSLPNEAEGFERPGIIERRSVIYRAGKQSFALEFDTPEVHSLTKEEFDALVLQRDGRNVALNVSLAMGDGQLVDRSLYFRGVSESVSMQAASLLEFSRFFPRDFDSTFRIVSPRGPTDARLAQVTWIGATDLAAFRMDVLRPPLLLLLVGLLVQFAKVVAAWTARLTVHQALFAGVIEVLVGIKLLVGYRVWSMPPHRLEGVELGMVAWMALPWLFLAVSVPAAPRKNWLPVMAGLLFSAAFCFRVVEGPRAWMWVLCHALAVGLVFARSLKMETPRMKPIGKWITAETAPFVVASLAFFIVRFILLMLGWKESIPFAGARLSLSAVHVPAAVILQGLFLYGLYARARRDKRIETPDLVAAVLILLFVWILPAALTSDIGLALLNIPVFVFLLLGCYRAIDGRRQLLPWALAIGVIVFVGIAPMWRLVIPLLGNEEAMLARASDSNFARFIHFAEPERLRELATKRGESLAVTSAILQRYISTGLAGRGYGQSEISPHLGDTALRDFAPAVFIAAEWGLFGTTALLLLYSAFFLIGRMTAPWIGGTPSPDRGRAGAVLYVAAATLAVTSIYMILANHELLLLTGKNAYLFGLDSAGDLLEVIALVFIIAFTAARFRDDDERPAAITDLAPATPRAVRKKDPRI